MNSGIYKLTFSSGKSYVGKSYNIDNRLYEYNRKIKSLTHGNHLFIEEFLNSEILPVLEILEIVENACDETLNNREVHWISILDTFNTGLNLTTGGDNISGEGSPASKFLDEQYFQVLQLLVESNNTYPEISKCTGVSVAVINNMVAGKSQCSLKAKYPELYQKLLDKKKSKLDNRKIRVPPKNKSNKYIGTILLDPQGVKHRITDSQLNFCIKHNISRSGLCSLLNKSLSKVQGWTLYSE